jgi:hypothetical protein
MSTIVCETASMITSLTGLSSVTGVTGATGLIGLTGATSVTGIITSDYGCFEVRTREREDKHNCLYNLKNQNFLNNFAKDLKDELCEPNTTVYKTMVGRAKDGYIIICYKDCYILVMIQKDFSMVVDKSIIIKVLVCRNLQHAEDDMEFYKHDQSYYYDY